MKIVEAMSSSPLLAAAITLVALASTGCAGPAPGETDPTVENVRTSQSALWLTNNCPTITGDTYNCTNIEHDLVNRDSYAVFYDLDSWGDQRVEVTNVGDEPVVVYVAQGFNKTDYYTRLTKGQSRVLERIDPVAPLYHVLFKPESPVGPRTLHIAARPFKP